MSITGFTGVLGGAITGSYYSALGNIELAKVPSGAPPAFVWFPFGQSFSQQAQPKRRSYSNLPAISPALTPGFTPPAVYPYLYTPTIRPGLPKRIYSPLPILDPVFLEPYSPPPLPTATAYAPLLTPIFQPNDFQRVRKNFEQLAQMINNLLAQGYIQRVSYNPLKWIINAPGGGVLSFNKRIGAVTLTSTDVITALGPQNPNQVLAGPGPSFRFLAGLLYTGNGAPSASVGYPGAYYFDLVDSILYQWTSAWTAIYTFGLVPHLIGNTNTPTVATGAGAGTHATASVVGSDISGTVTLTTSALDTPSASAVIVTLTFAQSYPVAPTVIIMPSSDTAWNLAYGVIRLRESDVTTAVFTIRSGSTPLPATTAATYTINYQVMGYVGAVTNGLWADDGATFLDADDGVTFLLQG
jgi:hypothetical protein